MSLFKPSKAGDLPNISGIATKRFYLQVNPVQSLATFSGNIDWNFTLAKNQWCDMRRSFFVVKDVLVRGDASINPAAGAVGHVEMSRANNHLANLWNSFTYAINDTSIEQTNVVGEADIFVKRTKYSIVHRQSLGSSQNIDRTYDERKTDTAEAREYEFIWHPDFSGAFNIIMYPNTRHRITLSVHSDFRFRAVESTGAIAVVGAPDGLIGSAFYAVSDIKLYLLIYEGGVVPSGSVFSDVRSTDCIIQNIPISTVHRITFQIKPTSYRVAFALQSTTTNTSPRTTADGVNASSVAEFKVPNNIQNSVSTLRLKHAGISYPDPPLQLSFTANQRLGIYLNFLESFQGINADLDYSGGENFDFFYQNGVFYIFPLVKREDDISNTTIEVDFTTAVATTATNALLWYVYFKTIKYVYDADGRVETVSIESDKLV